MHVVSLLPRSNPLRALCVQYLAKARYIRYKLTAKQDDLKQIILGFTESIFLPLPQKLPPEAQNIVQLFYSLTLAIFSRSRESKQPEDVKCCIMYLRYLRGQWHNVSIKIDEAPTIAEVLVIALGTQILLKLGDVAQDVEEMADLCDDLLNSDISTKALPQIIQVFASAIDGHNEGPLQGLLLSEKAIGCLRKAIIRLPDDPDSHGVSIALAKSLLIRFESTPLDDDCKEGLAILDKIIGFRGPGDELSRHRERALDMAGRFAFEQFQASGKPDHLEHVIYRLRIWLDEASLEHPRRAGITELLSHLQKLRASDLMKVPSTLSGVSASAKFPSFRDLTASLAELNSIEPIPKTILMKHRGALHSSNIDRLTDIAEIEDGIKYCQQLVASYPDNELASNARLALGDLFDRAFRRTNEIEYFNQAISITHDNISSTHSHLFRYISFSLHFSRLCTRFFLLRREEDMDELMQQFAKLDNVENKFLFPNVEFSQHLAFVARFRGHPSASTAYESAMSSFQASLTYAPTIDIQHSRLVTMGDLVKTIPLDYASYQIHHGQLERAIETLERGRSLLWSEMRGLRTSIDRIRSADSHLADKFATANQDLEALTLALSPNNNVDGGDSAFDGKDPYGDLVTQQRKLLDEREQLISQIQALPGFDTFMKPPSFDTLRSAASHGAVVVINHTMWRSDILILLHNSPPSLISTSDDFYACMNNLRDQLLWERKMGLDSEKYEDALRSVLKELYELVGRPVIKRLNELNVPEQSRIWWCPTSALCSLPLHAMGPIPSDADSERYFLDLYIPSYIPSLSTLIESHKPGPQTYDKPSLLLVVQPDENIPGALKEMKVVQAADTQVTTLVSAKATPITVLERLRDHPFVHIVSHGMLEPGKPFEAAFNLYRGKRLLLLDIVRSQLPNAEFAFLSACHTAELTDKSMVDEVLHLSAAMQFCGFRSVVGTMWAMADIDGQDLAGEFYKSVFSGETQGGRYYERTAAALRDAVLKLRRKRGVTLERWVNFVHYGA